MKKRIKALLLAVCLIAALPSSLRGNDMEAEAADRQLNIQMRFGTTEVGQYGVPNAFMTRYERITARVYAVYMGAFSIKLNFTKPDAYQVVHNPADVCRNGTGNFNSLCTHASNTTCNNNGPYHCTNAYYNISDTFSNYLTINQRYLLLTASKLCLKETKNGVDTHGIAYGLNTGFTGYENVVVMDYDYTVDDSVSNWLGNYENITWVSKTIAHEIGHFYDVEDHYLTMYGDDRDDCIWGYNKEDAEVCAQFKMCETCYNTIYNNRNMFNHE